RTGISPSEYLQRLRMQRAFSLLRSSQMSVKEIAYACGFSDPAYFSRCIRDASGLTPRQLLNTM
ncbi:MAG: helix-turn-helix transcriptional regulator, partial [Planctomycetes bacterium]|nr:helix-turn-helix transcriptional regulator [Planctomycetota bacterium]